MDKLNIASTGYPGTTESWKFLNEMTKDLATIIGRMIHRDDAVIITGCNISGGNISDGFISYSGEVFRFIGGTKTNTVVLVEEVTDAEYYTDLSGAGTLPTYPTYIRRYAKCGNPGEGFEEIDFDDFIRMDELIGVSERTKQATESRKGVAEIATQTETNAGTDDEKIVTPKKLATRTATESRTGIAAIATQQEIDAGVDDTKIVTPKKFKDTLDNMPFRIFKKFKINPATCNFGQHYSSSELLDLGVNIGQDNYMVIGTYNDNSLGSPQPILFTLYTQKSDDKFQADWVLDATHLSGNGTVSGWIDLIVVVF